LILERVPGFGHRRGAYHCLLLVNRRSFFFMDLNQLALNRCQPLLEHPTRFGVQPHRLPSGALVLDCGVHARGGLQAGLCLAEASLAQLGQVRLLPGRDEPGESLAVAVETDHPIYGCMVSQYAGWQIAKDTYYAMGSGPMRFARLGEELLKSLDLSGLAPATNAVGILESSRLPPDDVCRKLATQCNVESRELTLLVAPTSSLAGAVQVVARSVETALHKMHELKFDLRRVQSGFGVAPLPPVAPDDLLGIGRTNDAVLYGGQVTLWICGDDESLLEIGPQIPSSSSSDHGKPFITVFEHYNRDFYKIDPMLFSPAVIQLINVDTGNTFHYGALRPDVLKQSFAAVDAVRSSSTRDG
jgi:methenyltetrahydromethanopterin cyclohydrolase